MARRVADPVLVGGSLASLAIGALSYFEEQSISISLILGLTAQILTVAVDLLLRLERRREQVGKAGTLISKVESVSWLPDLMERYADNVCTVYGRFGNTIAPGAVREVLAACETKLRDLARGHLMVYSYDAGMKLQLLTGAPDLLRTTSYSPRDLVWHLSDVGRGYWRAQLDALARGWHIERIFIYDHWDRNLDQLAREQVRAGVDVRRVRKAGLPVEMQKDFTIWGQVHAFEQWVNEAGIGSFDRFTVDPLEIGHFESLWRRLEAASEKFDLSFPEP